MITLIVIVTMGLAGLALFIAGLRGKCVGDHPYCRGCGFDLFGRPTESTRCPECGVDVTKRGATVIGRRQRRARPAAIGVICMAASLGLAINLASHVNWQRVKPVWWLVLEIDHGSGNLPPNAKAEIQRRLQFERLSPATLRSLVERALARQTDRGRRWDAFWGDVVTLARVYGDAVSQEQWIAFNRRAIADTIRMSVRPRVRQGDPIPLRYELGGSGWRGSTRSVGVVWAMERGRIEIDDVALDPRAFKPIGTDGPDPVSSILYLMPSDPHIGELAAGMHSLRFTAHATVICRGTDTSQTIDVFDVPLSQTFELIPSEQPSVIETNDPALTAQITASLRATDVTVHPAFASASIRASGCSAPLAFSVLLRTGEGAREITIGTIAIPIGETGDFQARQSIPPDAARELAAARIAQVVLRPTPLSAWLTIDMTTYWSGDDPIVLKDVPITSYLRR